MSAAEPIMAIMTLVRAFGAAATPYTEQINITRQTIPNMLPPLQREYDKVA
jgi:hypothetical protein